MPLPWLEKASALRWPVLLLVAFASAALTAMVAHTGPAIRVQADELHPPEKFHETIIEAKPPVIDPESPTVTAPPCNCWNNALKEKPDYFLWGTAGSSYFDDAERTRFGGMYGLNFALPIYGKFGAQASGFANHYDGGTQLSGTLGLYNAAVWSGNPMGRFGGHIMVDQFTDSWLGNPYFVEMRYLLDYMIAPHWRVGAQYTDPMHGDDVDTIVPGAGTSVPLSPFDVIEGFVMMGNTPTDMIRFGVGYIDEFESVTYRLNVSRPISDRLSGTFAGSYDESIKRWSAFAGIQIDLSPRRMRSILASRGTSVRDLVRGGALDEATLGGEDNSLDSSYASSGGGVGPGNPAIPPAHPANDPWHWVSRGVAGQGGSGGKSGACNCAIYGPTFVQSGNGCLDTNNPMDFRQCPL
jgi:hypothetical protein